MNLQKHISVILIKIVHKCQRRLMDTNLKKQNHYLLNKTYTEYLEASH